jgi:predicted DNA-binding transcriptional regulator YafY
MTKQVTFLYENHRGNTEQRRVTPYDLTFSTSFHHPVEQWLLSGWCHDRQALRVFALSSILSPIRPYHEGGPRP